VVAHLFYLQEFLGYKEINSVFWTLCQEVQFYLIYALLLATRRPATALIIGAAVSLLWPLGIGPNWGASFLPLWHGFLLGVAAYWAISRKKRSVTILFLTYAAIIGGTSLVLNNSFSLVCTVTAGMIFVLGSAGALGSFLNWGWLQRLGAISYSLYLLHNPVTGAVFRIGKMLGPHSVTWDALWWVLSIIGCIVCASVSWYLIERPSVNLSRKIALR
jgi:peptidoglycan/LPS O-acetylase OafA/YrhL